MKPLEQERIAIVHEWLSPYGGTQAAGCPVIAYGKGGVLETVVGWLAPDATGIFFDAQTPDALEEAVRFFEKHEGEFEPESCRRNAERFSEARFQEEFQATLERLWNDSQRGERPG